MPRRFPAKLCCGCGPCRPKWIKMVDNIYAANQSNGITKLVCYCARKYDKLDNIAKYLHKRLCSDLYHRNYVNVNITMEAITALVNACYRSNFTVFDSTFLKMVQLLLESELPHLQLLGAKSFIKFSQIEEDAPSCHREYDELVDHLTRMSYSKLADEKERKNVRVAGIKGMQGIIQKTARDQQRMTIFQNESMEKIIPALLYNIHERPIVDEESDESASEPSYQAIFVFKDIACRASYTNIIPVVTAMLSYLDNQRLWVPSTFPLLVFGYLLDSIKNMQIAHSLVKELINHLILHDANLSTVEKISVVQIIDKTVLTLANGAIGPDVFHNFKALLQILRYSIEKTARMAATDEQTFQDAIIHTIAEFAKNLPDAQKIEILKFILTFDSLLSHRPESNDYSKPMVKVLVKTMLTVATQYQTVAISNAIDSSFLHLLLHGVAVDSDSSIRVFVQKILHALIDRHNNAPRLLEVKLYPLTEVLETYKREKPSRQDILFMKKTGFLLTENIYHQLLDSSNKVDNLSHLMCTIGLVALELGAEEVIVELLRLVLAVQQKTTESAESLPLPHLCAVHAILACAMSIIIPLAPLPILYSHVDQVIASRQETAPYLLPAMAFNRKNTQETYPAQLVISEDLLFNKTIIQEALVGANFDATTLGALYPAFVPLKSIPARYQSKIADYQGSGVGGGSGSDYGTLGSRVGQPGGGRLTPGDPYDADGRFYLGNNMDMLGQRSLTGSSISISESMHSVSNLGSRASDLNQDKMISFEYAHRILHGYPESRAERKTVDTTFAQQNYAGINFDELCARYRKRAQTHRFNMSEVFNDLSNELSRRSRHGGSRATAAVAGGTTSTTAGGVREKDVSGAGVGYALEVSDVTTVGPTAVPAAGEAETPKSAWDNNFISLFVA